MEDSLNLRHQNLDS